MLEMPVILPTLFVGGEHAVEKIVTQCSNCQAKLKVDDEKIGKKVKCPKCATVFEVAPVDDAPKAAPQPAPKAAAPAPPSAPEKIIAQCTSCQAKLKVDPEKIGKKVKCPKCQTIFTVENPEAAPKSVTPPAAPRVEKPKAAPAAPPTAKPTAAAQEPKAPAPAPTPAAPAFVALKDRPRPLQPKDFFETQHTRFLPEKAEGVDASVSYTIEGEGGGEWSLIVKNGTCEIREGGNPSAKTHAKMSSKTYLQLAMGKLDGRVGFMLGKIKIKGDKASVATVRECFRVASKEEIA